MPNIIRNFSKQIFNYFPPSWKRAFYWHRNRLKRSAFISKWEKQGKPVPPPHHYKQFIVEYISKEKNLNILIETGTFRGEMIEAQRKNFGHLYSIEYDEVLYKKAVKYFDSFNHITIYQGDSAIMLPQVLKDINEPVLFWLDGHWCGEGTGLSEMECPVLEELKFIFKHFIPGSYILIDDARCFVGKNDYPTIKELADFVFAYNPVLKVNVLNDIIHIAKK